LVNKKLTLIEAWRCQGYFPVTFMFQDVYGWNKGVVLPIYGGTLFTEEIGH
jgi:hypothetical protein